MLQQQTRVSYNTCPPWPGISSPLYITTSTLIPKPKTRVTVQGCTLFLSEGPPLRSFILCLTQKLILRQKTKTQPNEPSRDQGLSRPMLQNCWFEGSTNSLSRVTQVGQWAEPSNQQNIVLDNRIPTIQRLGAVLHSFEEAAP